MIDLSRRRFLCFLAAPAIVRASSLMAISVPASGPLIITIRADDGEFSRALQYLEREMHRAMQKCLSAAGPVYYNDDGIQFLSNALTEKARVLFPQSRQNKY